jgi:hypothetical protein
MISSCFRTFRINLLDFTIDQLHLLLKSLVQLIYLDIALLNTQMFQSVCFFGS